MEKNTDNDNKSDTKVSTSKSTENTETVENRKDQNVNLNGRRNEKKRLKNVLLHEKIKFK